MIFRIASGYCSVLLLSLIISLSSCGGYEKVLKSTDVNYKLTKANEYFDKKQYSKANELYRALIPVLKGTRNYEPLYYRYAYTYWYMKDYLNASYHFKNFTDFFPASKDAEESEFLYAVSLFRQSPKASLMQTNTVRAMEALQDYANVHPTSKRMAEVNQYLAEARAKLEEKEAGAAKLYYNIGQYKAAAIAYKSVIAEYPETLNSDYYQYMVVKSLYFYARNSYPDKQQERYTNTVSAFADLKSSYPKSLLLADALRYQDLASVSLAHFKTTQP